MILGSGQFIEVKNRTLLVGSAVGGPDLLC